MPNKTKKHKRNGNLFDIWSIIHFVTGVLLGWIMTPFVALVLMVLWEPLEIFVLSPILGRYGIIFGFESIQNSLSDIVFDTAGIITGAFLLSYFVEPPLHLF